MPTTRARTSPPPGARRLLAPNAGTIPTAAASASAAATRPHALAAVDLISRLRPPPFDAAVKRPDVLAREPGGIIDLERLGLAARQDLDRLRHAVVGEKLRDRLHALL